MELIVKPYTMPDIIEFNFDELKTALTEKVKDYETALYSDDQIKQAKADKASLNKLKKAINDERIRMEKEYMAPFTDFKTKVNEIIGIIDKPIAAIDAQVKAYDEKQKADKRAEILDYMKSFELPYGIEIARIFNEKWLNVTASMTAIKKEIDEKVSAIAEDLETLETLEEHQDEAIAFYRNTLDLRASLNEVKRLKDFEEQKRRVEEERHKKSETPLNTEKQAVKPTEQKPEQIPLNKPQEGQWVAFQAYLTNETALMLKQFFVENKIEFKPVKA